MRRIGVTIGKNGNVEIDFSGFEGQACSIEREQLANLLAEVGINLDRLRVEPKRENESMIELGDASLET